MARMVKSLMIAALMGATALCTPAHALQVDRPTPSDGFDLQGMLQQQLTGQAGLNALAMGNGLNIGNMTPANFGEMLAKSVMTGVINSVMSGDFNPQSMFGSMANSMVTGLIGGIQGNGMMNAGGLSNFGGFSGGGTALSGLAGGGGGGFFQQALGTVLTTGVQQLLGGIQGGSSGGGTSIGGSDVVTNVTDTDENAKYSYTTSGDPTLSRSKAVQTSSINYTSGYYDAMQGLSPDARFQFTEDGEFDSNYWAGYEKALRDSKKTTA